MNSVGTVIASTSTAMFTGTECRVCVVKLEVSTNPSGPPGLRRAAALAAEIVPMLVPTSQTGTGALCRR